MLDGLLLVIDDILTFWKLKASCLSNILSMNIPLPIDLFKSRKFAWLPLCYTFNSSSVGYISRKALPNSPPSFKVERSSINRKLLSTSYLIFSYYYICYIFGFIVVWTKISPKWSRNNSHRNTNSLK